MRRFRFSSWKFMLVMFVLIAILFYDLGHYETKERTITTKETTVPSNIPDENEYDAMEVR